MKLINNIQQPLKNVEQKSKILEFQAVVASESKLIFLAKNALTALKLATSQITHENFFHYIVVESFLKWQFEL